MASKASSAHLAEINCLWVISDDPSRQKCKMLVLHVLPVSPATYQWSSLDNAAFLLRHSVVDLQDFLRPLCIAVGMRTQSYLWFSQNICTVCLSTQTKLFQKACSPANCSFVICFVRRYKYIKIIKNNNNINI